MNKIIFASLGLLLAVSCTKHVPETATPNSQIGFYNASEYLQAQLLNMPGKSAILLDAPDTTYTGATALAPATPFFASGEFLYQFPNQFYYGTQAQPWISYLQTTPGTHTVALTDTGMHHTLIGTRAQTAPGLPVTVYFSDSLSRFRSWVLRDTVTETAGAVSLRVFDLSPDAGKVFFTINGNTATGFPDSLQYGQITPFTAWPNPVADTLQVRFYNIRDTVHVLTSNPVIVSPGHAYNLIFTGYKNSHSFSDFMTGKFVNFSPDLKILVNQNN